MLRKAHQRHRLVLLVSILIFSLNDFAVAVQNINAPQPPIPNATGDFITFIGQPANAAVNVQNGVNLASDNGLATGNSVITTPTPNTSIVNFLGNSIVTGRMGINPPSQTLLAIRGGVAGTTVTFNGSVASAGIDYTAASTMVFNANSSAALRYNGFNGTAVLAPGITFTGAATTTSPNQGVLTLNSGSQYTGAIGDATFFINQINLNANAAITGAIASQNIVLGPNTLTQTGAVTFPAGAAITVRALSDGAYGNINAPGSAINFTTGLQVNMLVDDTVILSGVPLQVVTGTSGTFGPGSAPITTTSNNVRFTFTGLNPAGTGNVLIFPTVVPPILPPEVVVVATPAVTAFDATVFGATGDLLLVQQQVTAQNNLAAIGAALAQLAPPAETVSGATVTLPFEIVNQFQNLWQANLSKVRASNMCFTSCDDGLSPCHSPCDPCRPAGELNWNGEGVWIDGFGYSARQGTRMQILGYQAKTYGGMVGIQRPISEDWQLGIGGGYAHTNITGKGIQRSGTKIETPQGTVYLGYSHNAWFMDNFFTYAWNHYRGFRAISFPGVNRVARASYNGKESSVLLSGGYNFYLNSGFTISPIASLQYQRLKISGYTEKNALSLNLIQKGQRYYLLESGLGLMLGYTAPVSHSYLYTEVHAKWLHDIKNYHIRNRSKFFGGGPFFSTSGITPYHNMMNFGISTTLFTQGYWALKASYECNYRNQFKAHIGRASIGYQF